VLGPQALVADADKPRPFDGKHLCIGGDPSGLIWTDRSSVDAAAGGDLSCKRLEAAGEDGCFDDESF
jgi:hypothetical protein